MAVDTVLFDLDDTLFDHRHARLAGLRALREAEPALQRFPLAQQDRTFERLLTAIHLGLVLTGKISPEQSRVLRMSKFLQEYRVERSRRQIGELVELRLTAYRRHRRAVPGAMALLRHLRDAGRTVTVVTNNLRSEQEEKLRVTGLDPLVNHLVCSEQVGVTKPDPRIFRAALKRSGAHPRQSVMVGDSWEYDVTGAAKSGIWPVWFHRDRLPIPRSPAADELRSFRPSAHAARVVLRGRRRSR